jgi:hypothetical protein
LVFLRLVIVMSYMRRDGESNLDWFNRYVMNEIPIRLIRLSDMTFVGRDDVRKHFQGSISPNFDDPAKLVKYAILSHRWLDEGEPTYKEMKSRNARGRGYQKLKRFCKEALDYEVEFAWSDTCCINKDSSTELDESIRSMFRWYRNSEICLIHLAQSEVIEDMMDDGWMGRGWTLQELLAPRRIKIFDKNWMPMTDGRNDKETNVTWTLARATGIPRPVIQSFEPSPHRVDERMIWAAKRITSRDEDVAYSLMGIFDVSLQIAYGEGGDRAFCRLIEAIMQAGDHSVLNWVGEAAKHHSSTAIPRSPQGFLDRGRTLTSSTFLEGGLEMTMTSLGLRVPLVILPLAVIFTDDQRSALGYDTVELQCPLCPTVKIKFLDFVAAHHTRQFAFGIVNYSLGSCKLPRIRGKSTGFILNRGREALNIPRVEPRLEDFVGLQTASPPGYEFDPWKKVCKTGLEDISFPNMPSDSFFYISRDYLEPVYL